MSGVPTEFDPLSVSSGGLPPGLVFTDYIELRDKEIHTGIYSARDTAYSLEYAYDYGIKMYRCIFSANNPENKTQRILHYSDKQIICFHNHFGTYKGGDILNTANLKRFHTFYLSSFELLFDGNSVTTFTGGNDYIKSQIIVNFNSSGNNKSMLLKYLNIIGADDGKNHLLLPAIAPDGRACLVDMNTKKLLFEEP